MKSYLDLLQHVITNGTDRKDRTGVGTRSVFGAQMRMHLPDGFPLLTTKRVHFKSLAYELLWFLRGDTNVKYLQEHGVTIWDEWADKDGDLGPVYGKQWRKWETRHGLSIDQIAHLVHDLEHNPFSRRHIVSAWNPADVSIMKLPPCHTLWQCYVGEHRPACEDRTSRTLSLHLYARSIDIFLGLPFNIASYALLLQMLAHVAGMMPWDLVISFGDLHLYSNHFDQAREQFAREPKTLPRLFFKRIVTRIDDFCFEDFALTGYEPAPAIKAPIAV